MTAFVDRFPMNSGNEQSQKRIHGPFGLLGALAGDVQNARHWEKNTLYLQIQTEGFLGRYGTTTPASEAKELIQAFCGIGLAIRLFRIEPSYSFGKPEANVFAHRAHGDDFRIDGKFKLGDHHSSIFKDIKLESFDGKLKNEEDFLLFAGHCLKKMRLVLKDKSRGEKITRAARWLFDSYTGQDEMLQFVQAMIALEVLLGDKDVTDIVGIGKLMSNRCAYLIGKTQEERSNILDEFSKIYRVRSDIVHSGKSRLNPDERALFNKLRWMCQRVIQEEVSLLEASS